MSLSYKNGLENQKQPPRSALRKRCSGNMRQIYSQAEVWNCFWKTLPAQNVPFPVKPLLQIHSNDPGVFRHVAFTWQLSILSAHSFISNKEKKDALTL